MREKGLRVNANSDRLGKSDLIIIVSLGRQKHVLFASSLVHFSHQKRRADDDFVYSFVRPLFSVALVCF